MTQHVKVAAWTDRPLLHIIAEAAAKLLARRAAPRRVPHDWREIERFRLDFEMRKVHGALFTRFKVM
jgi:hypothetical protein